MNKKEAFLSSLGKAPVIVAVKDDAGLEKALLCDCKIVFVLYGNICNIAEIALKINQSGKFAMLHADLIDGLAQREAAVDFIKNHTCADGILSTKPLLIKRAKALGLLTVQRFFMLDSLSFDNVCRQIKADCADAVEILPGAMPKIIKRLCEKSEKPVIAGGLICDKEDAIAALSAGAAAVSTTSEAVWQSL